MKQHQLIEYNKIFFFKNHAENEAGWLVPDLFLFFKKLLWGKNKWSAAWFQYISIDLNSTYLKTNRIKL